MSPALRAASTTVTIARGHRHATAAPLASIIDHHRLVATTRRSIGRLLSLAAELVETAAFRCSSEPRP